MRVTTFKDAYGYEFTARLLAEGKRIDVFLDGIEQKFVEAANEEGGYIIRCVLDDGGNIQIDPKNPDQVWRETVRGTVEIKISQREAA